MYDLNKIADYLEDNGLTDVFIGKTDHDQNSILLTQEAGGSSPIVLNGRSLREQDAITIRVVHEETYTACRDKAMQIYNLFRDNKQFLQDIVNSSITQFTQLERVKGKKYKMVAILDIEYQI